MSYSNNQFDWAAMVPHVLHPVKVAIIEALVWVEKPLSAKELDQIFDEEFGLSLVSYHLRILAGMEVVEQVDQQAARGALQRFYALKTKEPVVSSANCERA